MFNDIFSNLERSKELLYSSASIAHYQAAQEARYQIENMFKTQQETTRIQKKRSSVPGSILLNIMGGMNKSAVYEACIHKRQNGSSTSHVGRTGSSTKKKVERYSGLQEFQALVGENCGSSMIEAYLLTLTGKTVIFSGMVEELVSRSKGSTSFAIAYLYCKYNDQQRNNFIDLARSLIYQLAGNNDICYEYLFDVASNGVERTASKKQALMTIIQDVLQCYEEVFIGIDGLDECEQGERGIMIKFFKELLKLPVSTTNLRLFVTSQATLDIERFMASTPYHVKIEPKHLSGDIRYYVHERSAELARFDLTNQQICDLNEKVSMRSAGMFLLARLIFDLFDRCTTLSDFDEEYAEKGLPRGIEEAYGRILFHIRKRDDETGRFRAKLLLEILSCAKRKLYVHELQGMLSMDTTKFRIDFAKRRYTLHFKELCGPLVELNIDGTVDLVHQTVKEYLDQYHPEYVSLAAAAFTSAKICTSYLALDCFQSTLDDHRMAEAVRNGEFAFRKYAILQWLPHLHSLQETQMPETQISAELGREVQAVCKNLNPFSKFALDRGNDIRPAERGNFRAMVEGLEALYNNVKQTGEEESSILQQISRIQTFIEDAVSSEKGREKESFLKEAYGSRPYQCPSISCLRFHYGFSTSQEIDSHLRGHQRQFKCPFQECDFSSIGLPTKNSLHAHIDAFHVSTLIPQFSDLKSCSIWTALLDAIGTDDESLVENLCIEAGKHPGKPQGLLAKAILKGHTNSARTLFRHFHSLHDLQDVNGVSSKLLVMLAKAGEVELMRGIFHLCPTQKWTESNFFSAMLQAISEGQKDMITFLLEQIRLRGYWRPEAYSARRHRPMCVQRAAQAGNSDVLSIILDAIGKDCTPSHLARCCTDLAAQGYTAGLKQVLLFSLENYAVEALKLKRFKTLKGLSVDDAVMRLRCETMAHSKNGKGGSYKGRFQYSAFCGDIDGLSRILELGIDINDISGQHGTALQAASKKGHVRVVQWLLEQGAQVGTTGGEHGNAMAAAAATGQVEVLKILLATGESASTEAHVNTKKGIKSTRLSLRSGPITATPLHFAAGEMQEEAVYVLLEAGADVTAIDSNGNTALHMSVLGPYRSRYYSDWTTKSIAARIRLSSSTIAGLLLERGAIATAQNSHSNSPLQLLFIDDVRDSYKSQILQTDRHPCVVQMTKILLEAGASFDTPNRENMSARDAVVRIGGQLLEDLKQEIPAAWEDLEELVGSGATDVPSPLIEPRNKKSVHSLTGSSFDQDTNHFQEEENGNLNDSNADNKIRQMIDSTWNAGDTFQTMDSSYPSTDTMQWTAANTNETGANSHYLANAEYQPIDEMYETIYEIYQRGSGWNQQSNYLYKASIDLFMNPWATDLGTEMDEQMGEMKD